MEVSPYRLTHSPPLRYLHGRKRMLAALRVRCLSPLSSCLLCRLHISIPILPVPTYALQIYLYLVDRATCRRCRRFRGNCTITSFSRTRTSLFGSSTQLSCVSAPRAGASYSAFDIRSNRMPEQRSGNASVMMQACADEPCAVRVMYR